MGLVLIGAGAGSAAGDSCPGALQACRVCPRLAASALSFPPPPHLRQHLAIVMEYVGGGNLQQYVEGAGRLPEWQARCFFQQLILALQVGCLSPDPFLSRRSSRACCRAGHGASI